MIGPNEQVKEAPSIKNKVPNAIDAAKLASAEAKVIKMKEKKLIAMDAARQKAEQRLMKAASAAHKRKEKEKASSLAKKKTIRLAKAPKTTTNQDAPYLNERIVESAWRVQGNKKLNPFISSLFPHVQGNKKLPPKSLLREEYVSSQRKEKTTPASPSVTDRIDSSVDINCGFENNNGDEYEFLNSDAEEGDPEDPFLQNENISQEFTEFNEDIDANATDLQ